MRPHLVEDRGGILWRNASLEEKEVYERLADQVNEIHVQRHTVLYRQQQQALLSASSLSHTN
ncbi:6123_t:CDS:2, partial [Acaulospora colombiana]